MQQTVEESNRYLGKSKSKKVTIRKETRSKSSKKSKS